MQENVHSHKAGVVKVEAAYHRLVPPNELKPNPKNPYRHSDSQIKKLMAAMVSDAIRQPITVSRRSGLIVHGHARHKAALKLGLDKYPVQYQDYDSEPHEWSELVRDNKISELAIISEGMLADGLLWLDEQNLDLTDLTGYEPEEIDSLMMATDEFISYSELDDDYNHTEQESASPAPKGYICYKITHHDIWEIGNQQINALIEAHVPFVITRWIRHKGNIPKKMR